MASGLSSRGETPGRFPLRKFLVQPIEIQMEHANQAENFPDQKDELWIYSTFSFKFAPFVKKKKCYFSFVVFLLRHVHFSATSGFEKFGT